MIRYWGVLALALLASGCGTETLEVSGDTVACARVVRGNCIDWMTREAVTVRLVPRYQLCSVLFEDHAGRQVSFEGGALERYVDSDNWQCRTQAVAEAPQRIVRMADALISVGTLEPNAAATDHSAYFLRTDTYWGRLQHVLGAPWQLPWH